MSFIISTAIIIPKNMVNTTLLIEISTQPCQFLTHECLQWANQTQNLSIHKQCSLALNQINRQIRFTDLVDVGTIPHRARVCQAIFFCKYYIALSQLGSRKVGKYKCGSAS